MTTRSRSSHSDSILSTPLKVEQIVEIAQKFEYNPLIPLKYWLRTASTLLKEAEIYEHEGNDQQTYLLLFRHAQLVLRNLSSHPDAHQQQNRLWLTQANKEVEHNLTKLELLKPRLIQRYERHLQLLRDRNTKTEQSDLPNRYSRIQYSASKQESQLQASSNPALGKGIEALGAADNKDIAITLAHKEIKRRAVERRAPRQNETPDEKELKKQTLGLWGDWEESFRRDNEETNPHILSSQMQNLDLPNDCNVTSELLNPNSKKTFYHYPSVPERRESNILVTEFHQNAVAAETGSRGTLTNKQALERPLKSKEEVTRNGMTYEGEILERQASARSTDSTFAHDLVPSSFMFKPSAYLENGNPLRTIFLPPDLRLRFLTLALPNTQANLETCGILCGTLIRNALFISKLVIPDQESTSDTCETVNEDKLFDFVDGEDLMVLGWIHTHPTQTCFMSSRDLHTHAGYQTMMHESIAIVCAPSKGEWGVFRLTDPPGIKSVLSCTQKGLFHPHAEKNIYTNALRPGHVCEAKGLEYEIVDLRTN